MHALCPTPNDNTHSLSSQSYFTTTYLYYKSITIGISITNLVMNNNKN